MTEPIGLNASIFTYKLILAGASLSIFTTGVLPMVPRILSFMFMLIILILGVGEMGAATGLTFFIIADNIAACMSVASIELNEWVE